MHVLSEETGIACIQQNWCTGFYKYCSEGKFCPKTIPGHPCSEFITKNRNGQQMSLLNHVVLDIHTGC